MVDLYESGITPTDQQIRPFRRARLLWEGRRALLRADQFDGRLLHSKYDPSPPFFSR